MSCKVCGDTEDDLKATEYFNLYIVTLCPKCYLDWIRHYYGTQDFQKWRELIVRSRTLEEYVNRHWEEDLIQKLILINKEIMDCELKLAVVAEKYFKQNSFDS